MEGMEDSKLTLSLDFLNHLLKPREPNEVSKENPMMNKKLVVNPDFLKNLLNQSPNEISDQSISDNEKDQVNTKLPSDIKNEMIQSGISRDLCEFSYEFYFALRQNSDQIAIAPNLLKNKIQSGSITIPKCVPKNMDDMIVIMKSLEEQLKQVKKYKLRYNQIAALVVLLFGNSEGGKAGHLLQLATGEGKSCVIAFFALLQVFQSKTVDIICSNKILAERDQKEWNLFFQAFQVTSGSLPVNANEDSGKNAYLETYKKHIVYGTVNDFAADVLREEFEGKITRGSRQFSSLIVDEVDHLTLDCCLSLTYLSHNARGMHHLTLVYAIIWQAVTNHIPLPGTSGFFVQPLFFTSILATLLKSGTNNDVAMDDIAIVELLLECKILTQDKYNETFDSLKKLENLNVKMEKMQKSKSDDDCEEEISMEISSIVKEFEQTMKDAICDMNPDCPFEENMMTAMTLIEKQMQCQFHSKLYMLDDDNSPLLIKDQSDCENSLLIFQNGMIGVFYNDQDKLVKVISDHVINLIEQTEDISLPSFLHDYCGKMMPKFVKNAIMAAFQMTEGESYKIAPQEGYTEEDGPQYHCISPVDFASTGVLEKNKRYSEGTQQFLEMKHKLCLSDVTMTTNYMSNYTFYRRFNQIHGLSGTLGNRWDKDFMKQKLGLGKLYCFHLSYNYIVNYFYFQNPIQFQVI